MDSGLLIDVSPTHAQLVIAAREWLRRSQRCSVVVSEIFASGTERPDAFGWYGLTTHLVECKASRSDFLSDKKKFPRQHLSSGIGDRRWYLTAPNVIRSESELPEGFGWLELHGCKIKVVKKADHQQDKAVQYETSILLSLLKRIGQTAPEGCSITCYTHQTKNTTVLELPAPRR